MLIQNAKHYFVVKYPNKRELQQIASNHCRILYLKILRSFTKIILKNHFHFSE